MYRVYVDGLVPWPIYECYFDLSNAIFMLCLSSIAYGLHMATAGMTCYFVFKCSQDFRRYNVFIGILVVLSSINYFLSITQFIYSQNDPKFYSSSRYYWTLIALPEVMAICVTIICNSLMMTRCYVVWNAWKPILILPGLVFASIVISGLVAIFMPMPGILRISYWPLLLTLNVMLSALICLRILWLRRKAQKLLGKEHKLPRRTGVISVIIESSIIYTAVVAIGAFPAFTADIPYALSPLLVHTECIATELIVLRVVLGRAVTRRWTTSVSTPRITTVSNPEQTQTPAQPPAIEIETEVKRPLPVYSPS